MHKFYQKIYESHADAIDQIAERIRQYDKEIPDDICELISLASVKVHGDSMLEKLTNLHIDLNSKWNDVVSVADSAGDASTADMAAKLAGETAKFAWMLKSISK
jgi:DNA-binding ferritin-like protein